VVEAEKMEEEWWAWWTAINPKWRQRDDEGNVLQEGNGSWDALKCPGQNGFLNAVVCLKWWGGVMDTPSDAWKLAVADVKWVMRQMQ
jgi:hypothetical protein